MFLTNRVCGHKSYITLVLTYYAVDCMLIYFLIKKNKTDHSYNTDNIIILIIRLNISLKENNITKYLIINRNDNKSQ